MNVVVAGDFSPMNRVNTLIMREEYPVDSIRGILREEDVFVVNFESVLAERERNFKKITKVGPHLRCTEKAASFLKKAGVNVATLANNHTCDYGEEGLLNTIDLLRNEGIETVGAGKNQIEAQKTLYMKKDNETLAIINCCEHEFSYAEGVKPGTCPLDIIHQFSSIQEAKKISNYVIVIVHGGHEFFNLPSPRMVNTYRFFIDAGADAVINHHQHCYSGYEYYKGKPIYYGLGNFCFDWPNREDSFYIGYCVRLYLGKTISSEELPYYQCKMDPYVEFCEPVGFRRDIDVINNIICNEALLKKMVEEYYMERKESCDMVITPYDNKYFKELARRGLIPSFITRKKKLLLKAYMDCEAHRDVMLYYLKKSIN